MIRRYFILIAFLSLPLFQACVSPFEGVVLKYKEPIQDGVVQLRIEDFEFNSMADSLEFNLVGKDTNYVVTPLNSTRLSFNKEGFLFLAISPEWNIDSTGNFQIGIHFQRDGYTNQFLSFDWPYRRNYSSTLRMGKLGEVKNGVSSNMISKGDKIRWSENGIIILKLDSEVEERNRDYNWILHYFRPAAKRFLPGGGNMLNIYSTAGELLPFSKNLKDLLGGVYIRSLGAESEELSFSNVYHLSFSLDRLVKSEDKVPIYHFFNGRFTLHDYVLTKKSESDNVIVETSVEKPGYYFSGLFEDICRDGPSFEVLSIYQDLDIPYLFKVSDAKSNEILKTFYSIPNRGVTFKINSLLAATDSIKLSFFDYSPFHGGDSNKPIWQSKAYPTCLNSDPHLIDIVHWINAPDPIDVSFDIICGNGQSLDEEQFPAQMKAQYSITEEGNWKDLLTFTPSTRKVKTFKLKQGETYDFRVSTDGGVTWPYTQDGYTIEYKRWRMILEVEDTYCK